MTTTLRGNWNYPTSIRCGAGRIVELPEHCRVLGISHPLLVTDAGLAPLPMVARALGICRKAGLACGLFADVQPNPVEANVVATGPVHLSASAKVKGDLKGSSISLDEGAEYAGRLDADFELPPELGGKTRR